MRHSRAASHELDPRLKRQGLDSVPRGLSRGHQGLRLALGSWSMGRLPMGSCSVGRLPMAVDLLACTNFAVRLVQGWASCLRLGSERLLRANKPRINTV